MKTSSAEENWDRVISYLQDARSNISEAAEGISGDELADFERCLAQNELEKALDALERAVRSTGLGGLRIWELMAMAAKEMGLKEHVARFEKVITDESDKVSEHWRLRGGR